MLLLAFDTATPAVTVAVHDGSDVVAQAAGEGALAHGELLAPAFHAAMADAGAAMSDLTDVAVGVGPGPFTGLRVGVVTALTLGSTLGITTHGVCTLDILAAELAQRDGPREEFLVATDARRKEVYWADYRLSDGAADRLDGRHVSYPVAVAAELAQRDGSSEECLVATDARRKEVYWAHYRPSNGAAERLDGPHVSYPGDVAELHPGMSVLGRGATLYPDTLTVLDGPENPS